MFDDDGAVAVPVVDVVLLLSRCSFAPFAAAVVVFVEFDEYFLLSLYESLVDIHVWNER